MTLSIGAAIRDAWRRWTTERGVIVALAGPFLFLPVYALLLLLPEPAKLENATRQQQVAAALAWFGDQLPWVALRVGFELFATLAILSLFLARDHRDVRTLLRRSVTALPMFAAAVMTSWGLVMAGFVMLIVPGLYVYGRVALTGPVIAAEPQVGFVGAVTRSIALTHGNGWRVFAVLAVPVLVGLLAIDAIGGADQAMRTGGAAQPFTRAIIDAAAAVVVTASYLVRILLQVSLYRRLATPRHGV